MSCKLSALFFIAFFCLAENLKAQENGASPRSNRVSPSVLAVNAVVNSVVNLSSVETKGPGKAIGSGLILSECGLVLTSAHVVGKRKVISVTLRDGSAYPATLLHASPVSDLALLQITRPPAGLLPARFAQPGDLLLGESVIAVGNPFGLSHSISSGVLSSANRYFEVDGRVSLEELLQCDLAVNPGNSGGPLVNMDGEVIGINIARQKEGERIAFAVPVSRIESELAVWLAPAFTSGADLGFTVRSERLRDGSAGVLIDKVNPENPEASAELRRNQQIVALDGHPCRNAIAAFLYLRSRSVGDTLELTLSDERVIPVTVLPLSGREGARLRLGAELEANSPRLAKLLSFTETEGFILGDIAPSSPLNGKARRGDLLIEIDGRRLKDGDELRYALEAAPRGATGHFLLLRPNGSGAPERIQFDLVMP
ncbi:MAG: putative periplasmic serine endoprotease DegP-like precursor [Verrucomicrobiota bacterium]